MTAQVYVTRPLPKAAFEKLEEAGISYEVYPEEQAIPREILLEKVKDRDGILCILTESIDGEVFDQANRAKIFANYAVGFNNIDVNEATRRGIAITNTPGVLTAATADLAWALLFSAARRIVESDHYLRQGKFTGWGPQLFLGQEISGKTLGVIGLGRIGKAFASRAAAFGMSILYTNQERDKEFENAYPYEARYTDLDELLGQSDFVSIHVPLTQETRHLIGENELQKMKSSAVLVNSARGPIVDEAALVKALKQGWIFAAGLDVFEEEPQVHPELITLPNTVLCPHIGSATFETRSRMAEMCAENIIDCLKGKKPENLVNPEVWNQ